MDIIWHGHSCFRLSERNMISVVTDPYDAARIGYKPLKLKAQVVTISHDSPGHNYLDGVSGREYVLQGPGEYEIGGVFINGTMMYNKKAGQPRRNIVYVMAFNDLTVAHLGDLDHVPNQSEVDAMGAIDIALVPVGGGAGLHASQAAEVVSLVEPSIVIPMHYQTPYTHLSLDPVDRFLREMGVTAPVEEDTLKLSKANLPEQTQIVILALKD